MSINTTGTPSGTGNITERSGIQVVSRFLKVGLPYMVTESLGMKPDPAMNTNAGRQAKFRRWERLSLITTPLTEGITPGGQQMTFTDYTVQLAEYGNVVYFTNVMWDTHEDFPEAAQEWIDRLGKQAAQSMELIRLNTIVAGTSVFYQNGTARNAVNTAPTRNVLRNIVSSLEDAFASRYTKVQKASTLYNSQAIEPAFIAVTHTQAVKAIRDMDGFQNMRDYNTGLFHMAEFGAVEDVRFLKSNLIPKVADGGGLAGTMRSTTGTNADVYLTMVFAEEAFGIVPLKGRNAVSVHWENPKKQLADPLGQRGFASWQTYQACVRVNESWMDRWEHAVPA